MDENCIILHGCHSRIEELISFGRKPYEKHWIPWTKKTISARGIPTETPLMPRAWSPEYESFKKEFEKYSVNEKTVLVGHSCGCAFLVRWLGESKQKIRALILVAPWKIASKKEEVKRSFYEYAIDKSIKKRVKRIVMFTADDEAEDGKKSLRMYHEALGGKIIKLKGHGHYTRAHMGTEEFSELVKEIMNS